MLTSLGFHTFNIFLRLTYREAVLLYHDFKKCKDVIIRPIDKDEKNPAAYPKGYIVEYIGKNKGITWYVRFYEKFSEIAEKYQTKDKELRPYSVRAKINPKVLVGIRDYLTAANSGYLEDVETRFNEEAAKISPVLSTFEYYSMNRTDYCLNADLAELNISCSSEQMMTLIKRGDIPKHFNEWTKYNERSHRQEANKNALYLQNNSLTINCYLKHEQLLEEFPDCPDLDVSRNLIRFEVQCKYPKIYSLSKNTRYNSKLYQSMSEYEVLEEILYNRIITNPIDVMLSDSIAFDIVRKYFNKVIGTGDYYSLEAAREKIRFENCQQKVKDRLIGALVLVNRCRGISKAKALLHGEELEVFKRSLKELGIMGINPVTIPREWGIPCMQNLFDAYLNKIVDEQNKKRNDQWNHENLEWYIKDCKKQGKSFL